MDVILHLGAHRTATTSFQHVLDLNAAALAHAGVEVWTPGRTRAGLFSGLIQRPQDLTPDVLRRGQRASALIRLERTRLERLGRRQLLVSEENIVGAVRNNLRECRLYALLPERLERFRTAFEGVRRIGFGIRTYEDYWSSALAFAVAHGRDLPDADALDRLVTQPRRWRHVLAEIREVFPRADLVVWPFEGGQGAPDRVLGTLTGGITIAGLAGARGRLNPSPDCAELARILAARGLTAPFAAEATRWRPFAPHHREALAAQYAEDILWLRSGADGIARLAPETDPGAPAAPGPLAGDTGLRGRPATEGAGYGRSRHLGGSGAP